ncbi:SDR family NAD(P)-dependent oxidoreductase [Micromonospora sp. NIE79]|uniref:SDR family NAD(P)-dependent oxidoreductase n=1 Tax=Micromonospora trifolii TaxID=2911208 RepID=A0ABS9N632_9ACTN|nr:type I polyketide synthase [Micromonospora trifolii]MCG5445417.1 SDR family NAD(P)-dependent oxidoreductase [Micromonospora trifolii]
MPTEAQLVEYLKRMTADLYQTRERLQKVQSQNSEPIAIVGIGCRFPGGADGPEQFWDLVRDGRDAITGFPVNRGWDVDAIFDADPDRPGTTYTKHGGFLHDADQFDPAFFGISHREATAMDPQQRLLLETSWEAIEHAGIDPAALRGSGTGVFTGVSAHDYGPRAAEAGDGREAYLLTGTATSVASGRIAYTFGLHGPAITLDTACSSSLVALHLAVRALRAGECDHALAGGVAVMPTPGVFLGFSRQRGLAPDGRIKAFSADADGTAWAEGVGVVMLQRLSDAQAQGRRVLAVIRGSAVNQDGATSALTVPNGPAQQRVIERALADAGLSAAEIDVVEAHGTGTTLGDPIEAQALLTTYGQHREVPLLLGSVKSNIGHSQAAAGIAGVIKMVHAMNAGVVPATLHADVPTPHVDWHTGGVRLATEAQPWPATDRPRRAGVSAFGFGGTNAHLILEQAPASTRNDEPATEGPHPWLLSGRTADALRDQAARLLSHLGTHPDLDSRDVAHTLATARTHHKHRAVIVAGDAAEYRQALADLVADVPNPNVVSTPADGAPADPRLVFVFPGQGNQAAGMAKRLYETEPVFARRLDECAEALAPHTDWSLHDLVVNSGAATDIGRVEVTQPALFAVMTGLAGVLAHHGIVPDAVIGHSQGEIAAAHVAGSLSLADAAHLVAHRATCIAAIQGSGLMAAVGLSPDDLAPRLAAAGDAVSIAAINSSTSTVVSGDVDAVRRLVAELSDEGVRTSVLPVNYASHSDHMKRLRPRLAELTVAGHPPRVPHYSTVVGGLLAEAPTTEYWWRNLREPVRFHPAVRALAADGHHTYLELSPHPTLTPALGDILGPDAAVIATLHRDRDDRVSLLHTLARLFVQGHNPIWHTTGNHVPLPTYAFQHTSHWLRPTGTAAARTGNGHPLLTDVIHLADVDATVLTGRLHRIDQAWLADHTVAGTVVLPAAAMVEMALHAGTHTATPYLRELTLHAPLAQGAEATTLQVFVSGDRTVTIHSRPAADVGDQPWTHHASGVLTAAPPVAHDLVSEWPPAGSPAEPDGIYAGLETRGLVYGPAFRGLTAAWTAGDEVYAEATLPGSGETSGFGIHPALFDAALHCLALHPLGAGDATLVPYAFADVTLHAADATAVRVRVAPAGPNAVRITVTDPLGVPVLTVGSLALRPLGERPVAAGPANVLHTIEWVPLPEPITADGDPSDPVLLNVPEAPAGDAAAAHRLTAGVLADLRAWLAEDRPDARLTVRTTRALDGDPAHAAVFGLLRAAQSEHPDRIAVLDTDRADAAITPAVMAALRSHPVVRVRDGVPHTPRLRSAVTPLAPPPGATAWKLDSTGTGTLDGVAALDWPEAAAPLAAGVIRVALRAAGVNFRDVLVTLGMVPGQSGIIREGAGVVTEVGPGVTGLAPGDRVYGLFPDGVGPVSVTDHRLVAAIPPRWTFEQAAGAAVAYLTAYESLRDVPALRTGGALLVHTASGGVGMAAIHLARHWGAEVYATASPAKQSVLRELGVPAAHLASSRDLAFEDGFRAATGGRGVDVVLNSLADAAIDASLRLVVDGGRFIEMGKTQIRDAGTVQAEHPGLTYQVYDLTATPPDRVQELLAALAPLFADGTLPPAPVSTWDLLDVRRALGHMSRAQHTGKIVLTVRPALDPEGTVLITGAGTLGALTARHLVATRGMRHLMLTSRRGADAPGMDELRAELAALGATVTVAACDTGDREAVRALLDGIPADHPLTAVIHTAGVLADGPVHAMTDEALHTVLSPKADGAFHLHELTRDHDLAAFVLYSSASAAFGAPGQANYAAANAFLDGLAESRRAAGLPGTSIAWGLWSDSSAMTGHLTEVDRRRIARTGLVPIDTRTGLALLDQALASPEPHLIAAPVNLAVLRDPAAAVPPLLRTLVRSVALPQAAAARTSPAAADRLSGLPPAERRAAVTDVVRATVAAVLAHPDPAAIDGDQTFKALGVDSLTAVQVRNLLSRAIGSTLPATLVFDHPTPNAVVDLLLADLLPVRETHTPGAAEAVGHQPIAIVGMGCRYPGGVTSPDGLWDLVLAGQDAITGFPADRGWDLAALWDPDPDRSGTSYTRHGGFLTDADKFDPAFFGISPREATAMDPQQRLLLETAWETLEDAGIDPTSLRGSAAGVFTGVVHDYYGSGLTPDQSGDHDGYLLTGSTTSVASGRIAYTLGLQGPAITVDTACSSSLVAIHLATTALRGGECDLALAGGVAVMPTPGLFQEFSRQRGLSGDGRVKAFAAAADGTGFAEGVGMVALMRLSDARAQGRPVLAVLRGSAVNSDGASNGLTAPNGPAQRRVIERALADAGLEPSEVDVVEAHGTGTSLGDPIEAQAILGVYGQNRTVPLLLGSIKSNIGHTQAAAGVAGVIKAVRALDAGVVPATLHVDAPTPHVDWSAGRVALATENTPWPRTDRPRRAAVSSFGISGTNAHLILEQAPSTSKHATTPEPDGRPLAWPISAKSPQALREQARRLLRHLTEHPNLADADIAHSLATARAHLTHRAVIVAADRTALTAALADLAANRPNPDLIVGQGTAGTPVFVFGGQGAQWAGMGRALYGTHPVFTSALDDVLTHLDHPLRAVILAEPGTPEAALLDETAYTQPALFAIQVALSETLAHHGIAPARLVGHSIGELTAAYVAGVLTLRDAARLVTIRARLMGAANSGGGAMAAVELSEAEVERRIDPYGGRISVGAVNSPRSTVVSGDADAVAELTREVQGDGVRVTALRVSHAFHSPHMDGAVTDFHAAAATVTHAASRIPITPTAAVEGPAHQSADYWAQQIRAAVAFAPAISEIGAGHTFVEISPHPTLTPAIEETLDGAVTVTTLRRDTDDRVRLMHALGHLHTLGHTVDWRTAGTVVPLPTYAFQHTSHWARPAPAAVAPRDEHPLLGTPVRLAGAPGSWFSRTLTPEDPAFLSQHRLHGVPVLPAAAMVEWVLAAARAARPSPDWELSDLAFTEFLHFADGVGVTAQAVVESDGDALRIRGYGQAATGHDADWTVHVIATAAPAEPLAGTLDLDGLRTRLAERPTGDLYERLHRSRVEYGHLFRGLREVRRTGSAALALIEVDGLDGRGLTAHPAILDACFQVVTAFVEPGGDTLLLPTGVQSLRMGADLPARVWCHARKQDGDGVTIDIDIADDSGVVLAAVRGLVFQPVPRSRLSRLAGARPKVLQREWREAEPVGAPALDGVWLVIGDDHESQARWREALAEFGAKSVELSIGDGPEPEPEVSGIILDTRPLDGTWTPDAYSAAARQTLLTLKDVLRVYAGQRPDLVLCSGGAGHDGDLSQAVITAAVAAVTAEYPDLRCLQVDQAVTSPREVLTAACGLPGSGHLAMRDGRWHRAVLTERSLPASATARMGIRPDGTYLVTGGLGGLGLELAGWLADQGARTLVLTGRGTTEPAQVSRLRATGVRVEVRRADVTVEADVRTLFDDVAAGLPPLRGVFHLAGVTEDQPLADLDPGALDRVLAPKVTGAWRLHEATARLDLDHFVLFSSMASLIGSPGQAGYTAANAFLDALAVRRRADGLAATSVSWGVWADSGMAARRDLTERLAAGGIDAMPARHALDAFGRVAATAPAHLGLAAVDWLRYAAANPRRRPYTLLGDLVDDEPVAADVLDLTALTALAASDPAAARRAVLDGLLDLTATLLGIGPATQAELRPGFADRHLNTLGLDSLTTVRLRGRVRSDFGAEVPSDVIFGGTADAVADHVLRGLAVRGVLADDDTPFDDDAEVFTL